MTTTSYWSATVGVVVEKERNDRLLAPRTTTLPLQLLLPAAAQLLVVALPAKSRDRCVVRMMLFRNIVFSAAPLCSSSRITLALLLLLASGFRAAGCSASSLAGRATAAETCHPASHSAAHSYYAAVLRSFVFFSFLLLPETEVLSWFVTLNWQAKTFRLLLE